MTAIDALAALKNRQKKKISTGRVSNSAETWSAIGSRDSNTLEKIGDINAWVADNEYENMTD